MPVDSQTYRRRVERLARELNASSAPVYTLSPPDDNAEVTMIATYEGRPVVRYVIDLTTGILRSGTTGEEYLQL